MNTRINQATHWHIIFVHYHTNQVSMFIFHLLIHSFIHSVSAENFLCVQHCAEQAKGMRAPVLQELRAWQEKVNMSSSRDLSAETHVGKYVNHT